jgi:hypothetical protein
VAILQRIKRALMEQQRNFCQRSGTWPVSLMMERSKFFMHVKLRNSGKGAWNYQSLAWGVDCHASLAALLADDIVPRTWSVDQTIEPGFPAM